MIATLNSKYREAINESCNHYTVAESIYLKRLPQAYINLENLVI